MNFSRWLLWWRYSPDAKRMRCIEERAMMAIIAAYAALDEAAEKAENDLG